MWVFQTAFLHKHLEYAVVHLMTEHGHLAVHATAACPRLLHLAQILRHLIKLLLSGCEHRAFSLLGLLVHQLVVTRIVVVVILSLCESFLILLILVLTIKAMIRAGCLSVHSLILDGVDGHGSLSNYHFMVGES